MRKQLREAIDAACAILDDAGLSYRVIDDTKHAKIEVGGHKMIFARTPRSNNQIVWAQQDARRLVKRIQTEQTQ